MNTYDESTYGERISGIYDQLYSSFDEASIETLAELAKGGPALELGIGTGRIALPLQRKGVKVQGIDASKAMVEKLRTKPGGEDVPVTLGNFSEVAVEGQFPLIFVIFNTFFGLLEQDLQIRCFKNVAQHLGPEGVFLMEVFVPDLARFTGQQTFRVVAIDENQVRLEASQHDSVNQQVTSRHVHLSEEGVQLYPVKLRYAWPSELDLMARLAGLELKHRWGDWDRSPFSADSDRHISVYGHPQAV
jgi:SAM-dependent methyltransferase